MNIRRAYLLFLLFFAFLGGIKSLNSANNYDSPNKKFTLDNSSVFSGQLVFKECFYSPFNNPIKSGENAENQKENEKEVEDDNDRDEDDKDNIHFGLNCHSSLASKKSGPTTRAFGPIRYFYLYKQVSLFVLFHTWKSHLS